MKIIISLFLILAGNMFAQQNFQWVKTIGASGSNAIQPAGPLTAVDPNNNIIVAGTYVGTSQFGQTTLNSTGTGVDIFMCKLDPSGNVQWAFSYGSAGTDGLGTITTGASGDIYLACTLTGAATFGTVNITGITGQTGCLVKFDPNGIAQWAIPLTGTNSAMGGVAVSGNAIYVSGTFSGSASVSTIALNSAGSYDGFVASFDLAGNVNWAKSFGGPNLDGGGLISCMSSGKIYVYGSLSSSATFGNITKIPTGGTDGFVCEIDNQGTFKWVQLVGNTGNDEITNMTTFGSSLFLTGRFAGTVTFGNTQLSALGSDDVFVGRMDSLGSFQWATRFGEATANAFFQANNPSSIAVDAGGNVYTTGEFQGTHTFGSTSPAAQLSSYLSTGPGTPSSFDVYISKLSYNGNFLSLWKVGGTEREKGTAINVGPDNQIYLAGFFQSNPFAAGSLTTSGPENNFVLKMDADQTIGIKEWQNDENLVVFPVPASQNLFIKSGLPASEVNVILYDVTGVEILNEFIQTETTPVSIGHLPHGVYVLKITRSSTTSFRKIIIE